MSSRHLFSTTSFKSGILPLLIFVVSSGCTDLGGSSGSSSASSKACAGEGGLFPSPVGPQSFQPYEKYALTSSAFKANTPLIAIVNEQCVLKQPVVAGAISQKLRDQVKAQATPLAERAYPLSLKSSVSEASLRSQVAADPCLLSLSEDRLAYPSATTPNDANFVWQVHLTAIEAPDAWDTFYSGLTGEVVIAIIDDGMQMDHPDLVNMLWVNPDEIASNGIDDDGNGYIDDVNGYNFSTGIGSPAHEAGKNHGTHVAGLAAAEGNNSIGITGVMGRNVKIMVLNVFGTNGGASGAAIINAINYARNKGAEVINMSLGGPGTAPSVNTAMVNAVAAGSFIASAAGNEDQLVTSSAFVYPMGYSKDIEGAMAVGSVDAVTLDRSSFSNYSTTYVEIGAPGSDSNTGGVMSTLPGNDYSYLQGTSMASPVLAGAAALLMGWAQSRGATITPAQVEALLKSSADSRASLSPYFMGGASLNLKNLADTATCYF